MAFNDWTGNEMRGLIFCILFGIARCAHAHVLASDSFVCPAPSMVGQGGGVGWSGTWIADPAEAAVFVPAANSLVGPAGLPTTGGSLYYDGTLLLGPLSSHYGARIYRPLDVDASSTANALGLTDSHTTFFGNQQYGYGTPGTTVWLGFLFNGGTAGNGNGGLQYLAQVHLYDGMDQSQLSADDNNKDGEVLAIGRGNSNYVWNFERTCAHSPCKTTSSIGFVSGVAMDSATHWAVLRFDFITASNVSGTAITFWLDPVPGTIDPLPATALVLSGGGQTNKTTVTMPALHFNWVEFGGQSSTFAMDEMRIADTFADLSAGVSSAACDVIFQDGFD